MWIRHKKPRDNFMRFNPAEAKPFVEKFQSRYAIAAALFFTACLLASVLPLVYFFNENQDIFIKLAYNSAPELVAHLEQEKEWLYAYLFTTTITAMTFCVAFTLQLSKRIASPIMVLQAHLRSLIRGNWSVREIQIRENDEFRELIANYNYFYYCLRQTTMDDIEKLRSFVVDAQNHTAHKSWKKMIAEKNLQLGVNELTNETSLKPSTSLDSRRAS